MAIPAWVARPLSRSRSAAVKVRGSRLQTQIIPMTVSPRRTGAARWARRNSGCMIVHRGMWAARSPGGGLGLAPLLFELIGGGPQVSVPALQAVGPGIEGVRELADLVGGADGN